MSSKATQLLQEFETWPEEEKQVGTLEFMRWAAPYDSGPIDDRETAQAADDLFRMLDAEENESSAR